MRKRTTRSRCSYAFVFLTIFVVVWLWILVTFQRKDHTLPSTVSSSYTVSNAQQHEQPQSKPQREQPKPKPRVEQLLPVAPDNTPNLSTKTPVRKIEYGVPLSVPSSGQGQRTPVVMLRTKLSESLHARFLEEAMFSCSENDLRHMSGLDNRVKEPIYIFEGYYHSLPSRESIYSRNPNPVIGIDFMKPAASPFLRGTV